MMPSKTNRVQIDEATKNRFIGSVVAGLSVHQAGKQYGICKSTTQDMWKKWQKTGSTENLPRTGHIKKTTECIEHLIVCESLSNRRKPFCEIANATTPRISTSTVQNVMPEKDTTARLQRSSHPLQGLINR